MLGVVIGIIGVVVTIVIAIIIYSKSTKDLRQTKTELQTENQRLQNQFRQLENQFRTLERQRHFYSWEHVDSGCQKLARVCISEFQPDAILTFSGPGSVVAALTIEYSRRTLSEDRQRESERSLPVYTVIQIRRNSHEPIPTIPGYLRAETGEWLLFLPEQALGAIRDCKLTIIDDLAVTGNVQRVIHETLTEQLGFKAENLKPELLICPEGVLEKHKPTITAAFRTDTSDFYLPWGSWRLEQNDN
jgi:hypothetical protein